LSYVTSCSGTVLLCTSCTTKLSSVRCLVSEGATGPVTIQSRYSHPAPKMTFFITEIPFHSRCSTRTAATNQFKASGSGEQGRGCSFGSAGGECIRGGHCVGRLASSWAQWVSCVVRWVCESLWVLLERRGQREVDMPKVARMVPFAQILCV